MKLFKRWIAKIIADDIRNGGEIAKAFKAEPTTIHFHGDVDMLQGAFRKRVVEALTEARRGGRSI